MDLSNGLSTGFSIGIGIVGGVEIFMIICLIIVWFIELKMHKLKKSQKIFEHPRLFEKKFIEKKILSIPDSC